MCTNNQSRLKDAAFLYFDCFTTKSASNSIYKVVNLRLNSGINIFFGSKWEMVKVGGFRNITIVHNKFLAVSNWILPNRKKQNNNFNWILNKISKKWKFLFKINLKPKQNIKKNASKEELTSKEKPKSNFFVNRNSFQLVHHSRIHKLTQQQNLSVLAH